VLIDWADLDELSSVVPLIARVYPNGSGDVNHFHAAGGMGYIGELLALACAMATSCQAEGGFAAYATEPYLEAMRWLSAPRPPSAMIRRAVNRGAAVPARWRDASGSGQSGPQRRSSPRRWKRNAGPSKPPRWCSTARKKCRPRLAGDWSATALSSCVSCGPRANGMPELHKLTRRSALQDKGFKVALVDGRMSGASGKVPAAIHVTPEALADASGRSGPLAYVQNGDVIRVCAKAARWKSRRTFGPHASRCAACGHGVGRELFAMFRAGADGAEKGGSCWRSPAFAKGLATEGIMN
jgi:phosphogluconate dehydratase